MKVGIVDGYAYPDLAVYQKAYPQFVQSLHGNDALLRNINKLIAGRVDVLIENTAVMRHTLKTNQLEQYVKAAGGERL